jgi:hypothetical protein
MKLMNRVSIALVLVWVPAFLGWNAFALGGDYPNGQPVNQPSWPAGMSHLVNTTNRIGGLFVNAEDLFFYSGTATNLSAFLARYAAVEPIEKHRLILHDGAGEAFSLGGGNRRPCDWSLDGCPGAWRDLHAGVPQWSRNTNYVLEVNFWMRGKIALAQIAFPKNLEFSGDYFNSFESITNGMSRAEVEQRLRMDGGLQTASPVRFLDPRCPGFKILVEFEFQRAAAHQNRAIQSGNDKVIKVSSPYREPPFTD